MGSGDPTPPVPAAHFQYRRTPRDRLWSVLFALAWVAAVVGGVYAIKHRNPAFIHLDYSDPASCPAHPDAARALLESLHEKHKGDWSSSQFVQFTGRWLALSAGLALLLGVAFVKLFQHHSAAMTKATVASQVAIPAVMAAVFLLNGQGTAGLVFGGLALLTAWVFSLWRQQIQLATQLLGVSAHGLAANSGIITTTVLLNLAALVAVLPLGAFLGFAVMNGSAIPNPAREGRAECVDAQGQEILCCSWQPNGFAQGYTAGAVILVLWVFLLANQVRVFVTSGAIAQWYFAPAGALSATRGTTMRSLKHAMGPSFGSLCLSSLVLTISQIMRQALEQAQENNRDMNLVQMCLVCLAQLMWAIVEYLTKFATVMMAITGEAFLAAGRHVTDLLLRHFLNAFASTIWFTPLVIQLATFLLSGAWALISGGSYYLTHRGSSLEATPGVNASVLGGAVFLVTFFILSFLGGILLSVLDAVFVCWAIDLDSQTVSQPDVYAIFMAVPVPGRVVEQPDGNIAYGAGQQQQGGGTYQPPTVATV